VAKILVADDNSNIQKMVGLALKDQGIDVVAVGNGEAAVRKIADIHPDLVLADVFMPVRNGYEVCRYVKEDPNFSHIPVILLVGAFDPLDEQEAQRVGADGVLKKPFVPPDPLISMVKSALARAGVQTGPPAHLEKSPEPPRPAAGSLHPAVDPKHAAHLPEKIAEVEPESIETFPAPPEQVRIAAGHEPVAFGSLLETPEIEDDPAFLPKGREEIAERNWGVEEAEEESEVAEEDESPRGGWRKDSRENALNVEEETAGQTSDWRDAALHGDSPAASLSSSRWTPAVEEPSFAEAAHSPAIAVSTLDERPADLPTPFSGDAWAAAMAAGVEEKLSQSPQVGEATKEPQSSPETAAVVQETAVQESAQEPAAQAIEPAKAAESPNGWYSISSSPWDAEAKKASLLAATWDVPPAEPGSADVEHGESRLESTPIPVEQVESHYEGAQAETYVESQDAAYVEHEDMAPVETFLETHEAAKAEMHEQVQAVEVEAPAGLEHSVETLLTDTVSVAEPKSLENSWAAGGSLSAQQFAEVGPEELPQVADDTAATHEQRVVAETAAESAQLWGVAEKTLVEVPQLLAAKPDMDELVARVLEKMNPEVLQKMTCEFLKPLIAAIIEEELNSKKS
jgi:CheY-like chemotaxis protein